MEDDSRIPSIRVRSVMDGDYTLEIDALTEHNASRLAKTFIRRNEKIDNLSIRINSIERVGESKTSVDYIPVHPRSEYRIEAEAISVPERMRY